MLFYKTEHRKVLLQSMRRSLALRRAEELCLLLSSCLLCTFQHEALTVQPGYLPDEERRCQCSGMLTSMSCFSLVAALKRLCRLADPWELQCSQTDYIFRGLAKSVKYMYACQLFFIQVSGSFSKASRCLGVRKRDLDFYNTRNMIYSFFLICSQKW